MKNIDLKYNPLISIITVVFNNDKTLERTILSVINQTYKNIEYIIIDGGSTDNTVDIIKKYNNHLHYWISESDDGLYDAMNKGIYYSTGEYVGIINSDDWYELDAVEKIVSSLKKDTDIIWGNMIIEKKNPILVKPTLDLNMLKNKMIIFHPTVFVLKNNYIKYGGFNTNYKIVADWDLMWRFYEKKCVFLYCDEIISHFSVTGVSSEFNFSQIKERIRLRFMHNNYSLFPIVKDLLIYICIKFNYLNKVLKLKHYIINKINL